jgi:6-phosphogluconolactonase
MRTHTTAFGQFIVGTREELFAEAARLGAATCAKPGSSWALTGGSTPLEWYRWVVAAGAIPTEVARQTHFTVSDERFVPLADKQSNFGNATNLLFDPLEVPAEHRHPWPVGLAPEAAAPAYADTWAATFGAGRAYDVCFLGMGDDAHTASWFPGSPLLTDDGARLFAGIDVPGKGFRLTITPTGLRACGQVIVMTLGAAKAPALRRVLSELYRPTALPSQILRTLAAKVTWLVDEAAAAGSLS